MSSPITSNTVTSSYITGQTPSSPRISERSQIPEQSFAVEHMSHARIQEHHSYLNRAQENIDRLRHPDALPSLERAAIHASAAEPQVGEKCDGEQHLETSKTVDGKTVDDAPILPGREDLEKYVRKHSYQIDGQGARHPLNEKDLNKCIDGLKNFEIGTLENLEKEGVTFVIADSKKTPAGGYPGSQEKWPVVPADNTPAGGYYDSMEKVVLLPENFRVRIMIHETGHAIDDMLAVDKSRKARGIRWKSDNDDTLEDLYKNYKRRTEQGEQLAWSTYALTDPPEYLAEGVKFHNTAELRSILKKRDPDMYTYIDNLLKKSAQK